MTTVNGTTMIGWRARLGLLVPSVNTVVEPEMYAMAPPGVALITSRLLVPTVDLSQENLDSIIAAVDDSIGLLPLEELSAIAFCCTGASFYRGGHWDRVLAERIAAAAGRPAVTTSGAAVAALRCLGVRRVAVASPYGDTLNAQLTEFLEANEFEVTGLAALHTESAYANARHSHQTIYELARRADSAGAEGIFIPCTNLPASGVVEPLEIDLGKPVVSANQATFWQALRAAGIRQPLPGLGRLLQM
jgi:arylmalonate decarboxylase